MARALITHLIPFKITHLKIFVPNFDVPQENFKTAVVGMDLCFHLTSYFFFWKVFSQECFFKICWNLHPGATIAGREDFPSTLHSYFPCNSSSKIDINDNLSSVIIKFKKSFSSFEFSWNHSTEATGHFPLSQMHSRVVSKALLLSISLMFRATSTASAPKIWNYFLQK